MLRTDHRPHDQMATTSDIIQPDMAAVPIGTQILPPTSQLPPVKSIKATAMDKLQSSIDYLWTIYNPPVRGSLRRNSNQTSTALLDLRSDAFERKYSIKWLTVLISQLPESVDFEEVGKSHKDAEIDLLREKLIQSAASLLATCAGTASAGIINRTFVFDTPSFVNRDHPTSAQFRGLPRSITVELEDVPLDNHDYRTVGAQTWGSACILADMIAENPLSYGLPVSRLSESCRSHGFRCLELGAGTGLVSLTVARILQLHISAWTDSADVTSPDLEIIPTDYYPAVLDNLERNIRVNFNEESSRLHIHSLRLDWEAFCESEAASDPVALQNCFDVIYGADIVYEAQHAEWIKACLLKLLRKPDTVNEDPTFHLIIPLRKTHTAESNTIEQVFATREENKGNGCSLIIKHKEVIICESETGSLEEVEYVVYRIGWEI